MWTKERAQKSIYQFGELSKIQQVELLSTMNEQFPVETFDAHLSHRRKAIQNLETSRLLLDGATQHYPAVLSADNVVASAKNLAGFGIVFTAGGDGERLRLSLEEQGASAHSLADFTKATYALPDFYNEFGSLHINMSVLASICKEYKIEIPVVITTGPKGSVTARVIPKVLKEYNNWGLKNVIVVQQDERLHFTQDEQVVYIIEDEKISLVTHPDESGGPIVKLKESVCGQSPLEIMKKNGCSKVIILQGTAVYDPAVIFKIAAASKNHDGIGVGISRSAFPSDDPYGTYVSVEKDGPQRVCILEQDVRNESTRELTNSDNGDFLPYNTGFYAFDIDILMNNTLPDYATPPKQVSPGLEKSAKIGYAATDLLPMADNPAILTISPESYGVIKSAADLVKLSQLAKLLKLDVICAESGL